MRCGAHLHGARTMAEGAQIVGCEPARAALRFRAPLFRRFSAVSDPLRTWRVLSQPFDGGQAPARWPPPSRPSPANQHASTAWAPAVCPPSGIWNRLRTAFLPQSADILGLKPLHGPLNLAQAS